MRNDRKSSHGWEVLFLTRCLGLLAYGISRIIYATLRVRHNSSTENNRPLIFAFWHGKQFLPALMIRKNAERMAGLVSLSRDGEIMATWLRQLGYKVVYGSPTRNAVTGLVRLIQILRQGYAIGITPDGPTGPIYCAKPGSDYLAMKTGVPIIPLGSAYSSSWIVQSWDRYEIPKPFCRAVLHYGAPIVVPPDADLAAVTRQIDRAIHEADLAAKACL